MNLAQLKRRLKSVKSIVEITKAMELISAIKLNQIQSKVGASERFADELGLVLTRIKQMSHFQESEHYFFKSPKSKKELIVIFGSEKGLCGSHNSQLIRALNRYQTDYEIETVSVGSKMASIVSKLKYTNIAAFAPGFGWKDFTQILPLSSLIFDGYKQGQWGKVTLAYMKLFSSVKQQPVFEDFLPLGELNDKTESVDLSLDTPANELIENELPFLLELMLWRANLSSSASEQASRFMTMSQAKSNSQDLKDSLTLTLNDARQSQITNSLIESLTALGAN